jgi:predicted TPR repeat methyltransferase
VEQVFDSFASSFDAKLAKLGYRAPELVVGALGAMVGGNERWGTVADLGCGTGLVGALVRQRADRLVGVDLSRAMLEQARRRDVYDELAHSDLVSFLRGHGGSFDVVIAADVLCYFGVLDEVIAATREALRPGGVIVFTVESMPVGSDDWCLAMTGRYAHSPGYLARALTRFDEVTIDPCEVRLEAGLPVAGLLVSARA